MKAVLRQAERLAGRRLPTVAVAACLALALASCGGGTDPGGGGQPEYVFTFTPTQKDLTLEVGQSQVLTAAVSPEDGGTMTWRVDGVPAGTGSSFNYEATTVGLDSVRVTVAVGGRTEVHHWAVRVVPQPDDSPPAVTYLTVAPGPDPIEIVVNWAAVNATHNPIAEYVVALSYEGPISAANWDGAQILATVPHVAGEDGYARTFDRVDGSLAAGEDAWIAVRVRDVAGLWSAVGTNRYTVITDEWWIEGTVTADSLRTALGGVIVRSLAPIRNDNTDGTGAFRLGPYRSIDSVRVRTVSSGYFDHTTRYLRYPDDGQLDLVLVRRYELDSGCRADLDFLDYLRAVLNKTLDAQNSETPRYLWKPEHYPLRWFAADTTNVRGVPLDDLVGRAVARWDSTLGEPYFERVDDRAAADVVVLYQQPFGAYGRVRLLAPTGYSYGAGAVIPEKLGLEIVPELPGLTVAEFSRFFEEVAIHELGHVLGFLEHSPCDLATGHLMRDAGAGGSLSREHPIHIDEQRVVRCVRYLPQGVNLTGYANE